MQAPAAANETAALVLVDRALDIVTPVSHANHLVDQIFGVLQRRGHTGNPGARHVASHLLAFLVQHKAVVQQMPVHCALQWHPYLMVKIGHNCYLHACRPSDVVVPLPTCFGGALDRSDTRLKPSTSATKQVYATGAPTPGGMYRRIGSCDVGC